MPLCSKTHRFRYSTLACVLSTRIPRVAAEDSGRHNASRYGFLYARRLPRLQKLTLRVPLSPCRCPLRTHRRPPHSGDGPLTSALEPTAFSSAWLGQPLQRSQPWTNRSRSHESSACPSPTPWGRGFCVRRGREPVG